MFERFRRNQHADEGYDDRRAGGVATVERDEPVAERDAPVARDREDTIRDRAVAGTAAGGVATREEMREVRLRQRDEFGGFNWGAAFFGWLVAVGMAAILVAILVAAGAAIGLTEVSTSEAAGNAETISLVGGVVLVAILVVAYYAGGYVAGRMSRFDGARQGLGVWVLGLLATIALAILGAVAGAEYNVLEQLNLPRIPIDEGDLTTGGIVALAAVLIGTLLAAMAGGKVGERYHRRVDRAAVVD
jgi:hypothetical protein